MLPERFAAAFWPQRAYTVFGRTLRPYSLWHQFVLDAIESPLLTAGGKGTVVDLEIAIRVCRSRWNAPPDLALRSGKLTLRQQLKIAWLAKRFEPQMEAALFEAYIRDHCSYPEFWDQSGGESEFGAPPATGSIVARLVRSGLSREEAWETTPGEAHWLCAIWARQDGADIRFQSLSAATLDALRKFKAEYHAKKAAK